ncbi:hypothetical protein ACN24K_25030 [Streptomyces microflavus]
MRGGGRRTGGQGRDLAEPRAPVHRDRLADEVRAPLRHQERDGGRHIGGRGGAALHEIAQQPGLGGRGEVVAQVGE